MSTRRRARVVHDGPPVIPDLGVRMRTKFLLRAAPPLTAWWHATLLLPFLFGRAIRDADGTTVAWGRRRGATGGGPSVQWARRAGRPAVGALTPERAGHGACRGQGLGPVA